MLLPRCLTLIGLFVSSSSLAASAIAGATPADYYETVEVAAGGMELELPLNTYLVTNYITVDVKIESRFRAGVYEVSNRQWNRCYSDGWCGQPAEIRTGEGLDHPVVRMSWHDAHDFSLWLSFVTGERFRLPTDHEWFYIYSLGQGYNGEERVYDYSDLQAIRDIPKRTLPQGAFGVNDWGLADMAGNVWEWTLSCYTLSKNRLYNLESVAELYDPEFCRTRIVGGEHRAHVPDIIRDTYNGGCATLKPAANLGFRLIMEVE